MASIIDYFNLQIYNYALYDINIVVYLSTKVSEY